MDFEIVLESFERWFKGAQLTTDDTSNIVMGIILACCSLFSSSCW